MLAGCRNSLICVLQVYGVRIYISYKYVGTNNLGELVGHATAVMAVNMGEDVHCYYPH